MRTVALEEHFTVPALAALIDPAVLRGRGFPAPGEMPVSMSHAQAKLESTGADRLADMDAAGITLQVLSTAGPGADLLPGEAGVIHARGINDALERLIDQHPDRYAGFAHLPMQSPEMAADELERTVCELGFCGAMVNGMTGGRFLDDLTFEPLLARAEVLAAPIYLHPNVAPIPVQQNYYEGLPKPSVGSMLATAGWGWHSETAIHLLRLVLSGALERHPTLQIIVGHMGEMLPMMLARCDEMFGLETSSYLRRSVSQTILNQVHVTTSGMFTQPPFELLLAIFGMDRVMFSVDYPFSSNQEGRAFLDRLSLSPDDCAKLSHGNADRLLRLTSSKTPRAMA